MNTSDKIPGEQTEWFEMADLIAKRMAGALTREEEERLEAWYGTSAHHRDLYERICSDETLREKIRMYGSSKVEAAFVQFLERRRRMARRRWLSAARYAAVLVVPLLKRSARAHKHHSALPASTAPSTTNAQRQRMKG